MSWNKENQLKFPDSFKKSIEKMKLSKALNKQTPWNKGKTKKEFPQMGNSGVKHGNTPFNKDKKLSESHKANLRGERLPFSLEARENMKGRIPWNKKYYGTIRDPWKILCGTPEYKRFRLN